MRSGRALLRGMAFDSPILTDREAIAAKFSSVRADSENLAAPLTPEDWMLQSMPEASPVKWNLAHTSWFFETFVVEPKIHKKQKKCPAEAEHLLYYSHSMVAGGFELIS